MKPLHVRIVVSFGMALSVRVAAADVESTFTLSRTECLGACPVYRVSMFPNGDVEYNGFAEVARVGLHRANVGRDAYEQVRRAFLASGFANLALAYRNEHDGCAFSAQDFPETTISWIAESDVKIVVYSEACGGTLVEADLARLRKLALLIDHETKVGRWVGEWAIPASDSSQRADR